MITVGGKPNRAGLQLAPGTGKGCGVHSWGRAEQDHHRTTEVVVIAPSSSSLLALAREQSTEAWGVHFVHGGGTTKTSRVGDCVP
jgi:hypothetical protein